MFDATLKAERRYTTTVVVVVVSTLNHSSVYERRRTFCVETSFWEYGVLALFGDDGPLGVRGRRKGGSHIERRDWVGGAEGSTGFQVIQCLMGKQSVQECQKV